MDNKRTKAILKAIGKTVVYLIAFPFIMVLAIIYGLYALMQDIFEDLERDLKHYE